MPVLIVLAALALIVTASLRATADRATGLLTNVIFGITVIQGQALPIHELWRQVSRLPSMEFLTRLARQSLRMGEVYKDETHTWVLQ